MPARMVLLVVVATVATWWLTGQARRYALEHQLLDIPNERSSHTAPTPRGGGIAIALVTLVGIALLGTVGMVTPATAIAMVGGGTAIAIVGWIDDRFGVGPAVRILVHFAAATWAVWWLGGMSSVRFGTEAYHLGMPGSILAIVGIVWAVNLYNFMDGIDGLAASEAVAVGGVGGVLLITTGQTGLGAVALLIASAGLGFLFWNWPPAAIFMGDVASGLLGFLLASVALKSETVGSVPLLAWSLLLGVFLCDATITLFFRVIRRERWYAAHRTHAYQRLVVSGWSHLHVTVLVMVLNLLLAAGAWWLLVQPERSGLIGGLAVATLTGSYLAVGSMTRRSRTRIR